jgi:TRAP-type C4-dicarboxylate transport system substrate-binding protein
MIKKTLCAIFVLAAFVALSFGVADAKMIVKYGHVGPPIHPQHHAALAFAKYVKKQTGRLRSRSFPLASLAASGL